MFDWVAIDPKHSEFLNRQRQDWKRLDKLSAWRPEHSGRPNPDLLAPKSKPAVSRVLWGAMAAAAAIAVAFVSYQQSSSRMSESASELVAESKPEIRNELDDVDLFNKYQFTDDLTAFGSGQNLPTGDDSPHGEELPHGEEVDPEDLIDLGKRLLLRNGR